MGTATVYLKGKLTVQAAFTLLGGTVPMLRVLVACLTLVTKKQNKTHQTLSYHELPFPFTLRQRENHTR